MSDLFHENVPASFISQVFSVMAAARQHTFQLLTKRPERAAELFSTGELASPSNNVWMGVSIESAKFTSRADTLRAIPARIRFISAEPLLGSLFESSARVKSLMLTGIDWLIAGGESGLHARPMQADWVRELRDACRDAEIPFFFKQWGGRTPKTRGRILDQKLHDDMPRPVTITPQIAFASLRDT